MTSTCTLHITYKAIVNHNVIDGNMNIHLANTKDLRGSIGDEEFQENILNNIVKPLFNEPSTVQIDWASATIEMWFD